MTRQEYREKDGDRHRLHRRASKSGLRRFVWRHYPIIGCFVFVPIVFVVGFLGLVMGSSVVFAVAGLVLGYYFMTFTTNIEMRRQAILDSWEPKREEYLRMAQNTLSLKWLAQNEIQQSGYGTQGLRGTVDGMEVRISTGHYTISGDVLYGLRRPMLTLQVNMDGTGPAVDLHKGDLAKQVHSLQRKGLTAPMGDSRFDKEWYVKAHLEEQALTQLAPEIREHLVESRDTAWSGCRWVDLQGGWLQLHYSSNAELRAECGSAYENMSTDATTHEGDLFVRNIRTAVAWAKELQQITDRSSRSLQARLAEDPSSGVRKNAFKFIKDGHLNDGPKKTLLRGGCKSPYLDTRIRCAEALGDEAKHILEEAQALLASKQGTVAISGAADAGDVSMTEDSTTLTEE